MVLYDHGGSTLVLYGPIKSPLGSPMIQYGPIKKEIKWGKKGEINVLNKTWLCVNLSFFQIWFMYVVTKKIYYIHQWMILRVYEFFFNRHVTFFRIYGFFTKSPLKIKLSSGGFSFLILYMPVSALGDMPWGPLIKINKIFSEQFFNVFNVNTKSSLKFVINTTSLWYKSNFPTLYHRDFPQRL